MARAANLPSVARVVGVIVALVVIAVLLGACASDTQTVAPTESTDIDGVDVDEVPIKLHDGRTVVCLRQASGNGNGGLSCDWRNAR